MFFYNREDASVPLNSSLLLALVHSSYANFTLLTQYFNNMKLMQRISKDATRSVTDMSGNVILITYSKLIEDDSYKD